MPPTPKPPAQRRRRNADQPQWRHLPADGGAARAPSLPRKDPPWLRATREWWRAIWASPMAGAWLASDVPTLIRLARIVDADNRGEPAPLSEARQLEDRFGLSPLARRRLQWEVARAGAAPAGPEDEDAAPPGGPPGRRPGDVRRLRAGDTAS